MLANLLLFLGIGLVVIWLGFIALIAKAHHKVSQGKALLRTGFGGSLVALDSGMFVMPVLHRVEEIDITVKIIEIHRIGSEGLIFKDQVRSDIKVTFYIRIVADPAAIITVAQSVSCARTFDQKTLSDLFYPKFLEALKIVSKQFDFVALPTQHEAFKNAIFKTVGVDLNGYLLDDLAIDYPIKQHNKKTDIH